MDTTFDFEEWLDAADPCDSANVAGLVEAVEGECEFSGFKAERAANGMLIVSADSTDLKLILSTKKAEEGFIGYIHVRNVEPGMSAEIQAAVDHLNERD
ncbi:hypothetical protein [Janthinobacterium sp. PSPC3-1]|uniref:hypothetical protein n=1 Tax=Janthinobacterium sp. PSPC3-1 TaxID=2804653 RepID=UPI003CF4281D